MAAEAATPVRLVQRGGFTLIELIVAMALVAVLSLSLYASLRVAFGAQRSAEAAIEPSRTAAVVLDQISADLRSAVVPNEIKWAQQMTGTDNTDGRGRPADDVVFFAVADSPLHAAANGDVKQFEITVVDSPDGRDRWLVRRVVRNLLTQGTAPTPDTEVLCRGVGGLDLRYYTGSDWLTTWDSTQENNTLPAAIEVTLLLDRANGRTQPDGTRAFRFTRIVPLPCSTAAQDSTVNANAQNGGAF